MIVDGQRNLKVHFAAVENIDQLCSAKAAGVKYLLFTCFPLIAEKVGIKTIKIGCGIQPIQIPSLLQKHSRHTIMDSGLFTLMFGSHSGKKDATFIEKWYDNLIGFVSEASFKGTVVEVDCQKVLGVDAAWKFREKMRSDLENRVINVFHKEDGQKGLDRLIEFSDYIAISVPELRFMGQKNYVPKIANYIKSKKPSIDIHLLGCTEAKLLNELSFCSTSDSSSWTSSPRYGTIRTLGGSKSIGQVNENGNEFIELKSRVLDFAQQNNIKLSNLNRTTKTALSALSNLQIYTVNAGDQS